MLKRLAAELVLLVHFGFVAFAVLGGFLGILNRSWLWLHAPVVVWSSVVNLAAWTCPLTPLEQFLRRQAGQAGYTGGFVQHYIGPLVYPRGMPRRLELVAAFSIVAGNSVVYAFVLIALPLLRHAG
jgi:Protein of Unknown function (DUF2784)